VTPEGYAHMTHMLAAVAPLAVLLEGGYNLRATAAGCEAVLRVLLGQKVPAFSRPAVPCTAGLMAIQQVIKTQVRCTMQVLTYVHDKGGVTFAEKERIARVSGEWSC